MPIRPSSDLIGSDRLAENLGRKAENQLHDMTLQNQSVYSKDDTKLCIMMETKLKIAQLQQ